MRDGKVIETYSGLPPLDSLAVGEIDFVDVAEALEGTLAMIAESGLIH